MSFSSKYAGIGKEYFLHKDYQIHFYWSEEEASDVFFIYKDVLIIMYADETGDISLSKTLITENGLIYVKDVDVITPYEDFSNYQSHILRKINY